MQEFLNNYKTENETGFFKDIPIEYVENVRQYFKDIGVKVRIRYRGPRLDGMRLTCLRKNAKRFSVYINGKHNRYVMLQEDKDFLTNTAAMAGLSYIQKTIKTTPRIQLSDKDIEKIEAIYARYIELQLRNKHGQFKEDN